MPKFVKSFTLDIIVDRDDVTNLEEARNFLLEHMRWESFERHIREILGDIPFHLSAEPVEEYDGRFEEEEKS